MDFGHGHGHVHGKHRKLLLAACTNSSVSSFPYKYMSCLPSLIWSNRVWISWYLIIWSEITVQSSTMDFWIVIFPNWFVTVWNFILESRFQDHPDSIIWQKYQSFSNQSFKHISAHIPSLNLTPSFLSNQDFVYSSLTVTI